MPAARHVPAAQALKAAVRAAYSGAGGGGGGRGGGAAGGRWGKPAKAPGGGGGGLAAYLRCACCMVDCSGEDAFIQHINGRAHMRKSRGRVFAGLVPNSQAPAEPRRPVGQCATRIGMLLRKRLALGTSPGPGADQIVCDGATVMASSVTFRVLRVPKYYILLVLSNFWY